MNKTIEMINKAYRKHDRAALAFSGGGDSMVLLDIVYHRTKHRPILIFADSGMEYPATIRYVKKTAKKYGADLLIAKPNRTPAEQWQRSGWPMLGKLAARLWMQKNKNIKGFRLNVTLCCRNMKIAPARKLIKAQGINLHFTGQRGGQDDALRGMRTIKDDTIKFIKEDKLYICNPLTGWTDTMIRRYSKQNDLDAHPLKKKGAITIGCMYCGGGAQFENSGLRILRRLNKKAWTWFVVEQKAGEIVLAIKHGAHINATREATKKLGGLQALADKKPHVFDFLTITPRKGYDK